MSLFWVALHPRMWLLVYMNFRKSTKFFQVNEMTSLMQVTLVLLLSSLGCLVLVKVYNVYKQYKEVIS